MEVVYSKTPKIERSLFHRVLSTTGDEVSEEH
jgi:hypothetical protein